MTEDTARDDRDEGEPAPAEADGDGEDSSEPTDAERSLPLEFDTEVGPGTVLALPPAIWASAKLFESGTHSSQGPDVDREPPAGLEPGPLDGPVAVSDSRPEYLKPEGGRKNWHLPLNENFERVEDDIQELRRSTLSLITEADAGTAARDEPPNPVVVAADTSNAYREVDDAWEWFGKLDYRPELAVLVERITDLEDRLDELEAEVEKLR